jgi:two-component sensor histidine kinase
MDAILKFEPRTPAISPADVIAEANHRIANSLSLVVGMVRTQAASVKKNPVPMTNAEVRMLLDGVAARINTIAQLHRLLSYRAADGAISLRPHLQEITDALVAGLSSPEQMARVVHTGCDCMMEMRHVQPVVLIICEVFINAMKYAHPAGMPLVMMVDCSVTGDGMLTLTISDDGVGLPEGYDVQQTGGMGFRVIRSLASEIGADLQIQSTHLGLTTRLSLPASAMTGAKLA